MTYSRKLYVIGEKQGDVLFIATDPLRVARITAQDVHDYVTTHPMPPMTDDGIQKDMAASIKTLLLTLGNAGIAPIKAPVGRAIGEAAVEGATISDAEYCFITELTNVGWETSRNPFPPLHDVLLHFHQGATGNPPDTIFEAPIVYP